MRTCALLLALTVAAAAFGDAQAAARRRSSWRPLLPGPTPPAVAATCQAAHDADKRVSVTFCTSLFAQVRPRPRDTDVRTLAETAAYMGAGRADTAQTTIDRKLNQRGVDDPKLRRALERCDRLYGSAGAAFKAAGKAIAEGRYADVRRSLEGVPELGRQCNSENAPAGSDDLASIWFFSGANEELAYLTIAITSLIK